MRELMDKRNKKFKNKLKPQVDWLLFKICVKGRLQIGFLLPLKCQSKQ